MRKGTISLVIICLIVLGVCTLPSTPFTPEASRTGALAIGTKVESTGTEASPPGNILLVNANHPLPEESSPDLVNLYDQKGRAFQLSASDISVDRQVFEAMNRMFTEAKRNGIKGFIVTSGYRTREEQQKIYDESPAGIAALPGTSEHETGLAFDVTCRRDDGGEFEKTAQFRWLSEHCWDFGFILRYPKGKIDITGIEYEPWHYRYVGVGAAQEMRDSGQTLEEYLGVN